MIHRNLQTVCEQGWKASVNCFWTKKVAQCFRKTKNCHNSSFYKNCIFQNNIWATFVRKKSKSSPIWSHCWRLRIGSIPIPA